MKYSHTLEDKIVRDAIFASTFIDDSMKKCIGGGMSAQFYLPGLFHRYTGDLDITINNPLAYSEFKRLMESVIEVVEKMGYSAHTKKERQTNDLFISSNREDDGLKVQLPRRSPNIFYDHKERLNREIEHSVSKDFHSMKLKVLRPEDLILRKMARIIIFEEEYRLSPIPVEQDPLRQMNYLEGIRKDFDPLDANPSDVAWIRMQADLFDVNSLMEKGEFEFDKEYLKDGIRFYNTLSKNLEKTKKIAYSINGQLDLSRKLY